MRLYRSESSDPKINAQHNLQGRTHYVDPDTLKFFRGRVLAFRIHSGGLLCSIIESVKAHDDRRIFRYVIFDIEGNILARPTMDGGLKNRSAAEKAMYKVLDGIDAVKVCRAAMKAAYDNHRQQYARDLVELKAKAAELKSLKIK